MNDRMAALAARWNSRSARAGRTLRSRPTIEPTNALTSTRRANWRQFRARPSATIRGEAHGRSFSTLLGAADLHGQAGGAPLGEAVSEAARTAAARAQSGHGLVGHDAVRPAAIGHDVLSQG